MNVLNARMAPFQAAMLKKLSATELVGAIVIAVLAFVFHFLYEWSGYNTFVGLFSATNESVFEHIKILFFPFVLFSIGEYFLLDVDFKRFFVAKALAAFLIIAMLIVVFYTYTGIIGKSIVAVDILSAVLYAFIAQFFSYKLLTSEMAIERFFIPVAIIFTIVVASIFLFTINPPHIPLFYDTAHGIYGGYKS